MPGQARLGVGPGGPGQGLVDAIGFLAATIGLAGHVYQGDQGAFHRGASILGDGLLNGPSQAPTLQQTDLALAGARKGILGIRYHRQPARGASGQFEVGDAQGGGQAGDGLTLAG